MNIEIIKIEGMLPNPSVLGRIEEHKEFILYQNGEQFIALPGLLITYKVDVEEKTHVTTELEFFYKNSAETLSEYNKTKEFNIPDLINTAHLQEAFMEYRNDYDKFFNRVKEYYGSRLS